jgi:hypothetical protein
MMERDHLMDAIQQYSVSQGHFISQPADLPKPMVGASSNDQRFLLVFIMGSYFGPDLKEEVTRKSAFQRQAQCLPPYTSDQLRPSFLKLSEIESIYYYILRNAHPSAAVKLQSLYKFLQGHLAPPFKEVLEDDRQFTSIFPPNLHTQYKFKRRYKVFEAVIFIDDPDISYIKPENLERFKHLTGLNDLRLDREEAQNYRHSYGPRMDRDEARQTRIHSNAGAHANVADGRPLAAVADGRPLAAIADDRPLAAVADGRPLAAVADGLQDLKTTRKRKAPTGKPNMPASVRPPKATVRKPKEEKSRSKYPDNVGTAVLMVASTPTIEQWNTSSNHIKPSIDFTGTATARQAGPSVGLVDIGICEDAYLFRIALPGVKKDQREFSCEVESDGKVLIRGTTTTGEQRVIKNSRTFYMKTQSLCPPGPFTVSFQLPGPVEPRQFTGNFGSDAILEGIVMKQKDRIDSAYLVFQP